MATLAFAFLMNLFIDENIHAQDAAQHDGSIGQLDKNSTKQIQEQSLWMQDSSSKPYSNRFFLARWVCTFPFLAEDLKSFARVLQKHMQKSQF